MKICCKKNILIFSAISYSSFFIIIEVAKTNANLAITIKGINILKSKNLTFSEVNFDYEDNLRSEVVGVTGHRTVPICFDMRGEKPIFIGGSDHLIDYL